MCQSVNCVTVVQSSVINDMCSLNLIDTHGWFMLHIVSHISELNLFSHVSGLIFLSVYLYAAFI